MKPLWEDLPPAHSVKNRPTCWSLLLLSLLAEKWRLKRLKTLLIHNVAAAPLSITGLYKLKHLPFIVKLLKKVLNSYECKLKFYTFSRSALKLYILSVGVLTDEGTSDLRTDTSDSIRPNTKLM